MNWLKKILNWFGFTLSRRLEPIVPPQKERFHCIRFMTEKGEQIGILLTTEEFERGIARWVDTIDEMPIQMTDKLDEESMP